MNNEKSARINKAIRNTKASFAIEGMYLTQEEKNLIREKIEGKITEEEFTKRALELIHKEE